MLGESHSEGLTPTRILAGKYQLGRLLGEGGMGAVYEAVHLGLGTTVAVKLLSDRLVADPKSQQRFRREARAAAAVRHPNVVSVTDTGTDEDGMPFLVMERLYGESLSSTLHRQRILAVPVASAIIIQVLQGLTAAHARGVIHRDLKPGNIFVTRPEDDLYLIKILDFGISKFAEKHHDNDWTDAGLLVGTPSFMAPEQLRRESDIDQRVDIYAVGVLLYRMTTGHMPVVSSETSHHAEPLPGLSADRPLAPSQIRHGYPPALESVVLQAMARWREDRYNSAACFEQALRKAVPDLPTTGRFDAFAWAPAESVASAPPRAYSGIRLGRAGTKVATKMVQKRRWWQSRLLWMSATIVVALACLAGLWSWRTRRHHAAAPLAPPPSTARQLRPLRLGVTRYVPHQVIRHPGQALASYLHRQLGRRVVLTVVKGDQVLSEHFLEGKLDMAALSPYAYIRVKKQAKGLHLLATPVTRSGAFYQGYVLTRANAPWHQLRDLRQQTFCYVNPSSTSGYLYPRALLRRAGLDPDTDFHALHFAGDHLAAIQALNNGTCDGAAVYTHILFEIGTYGIFPNAFRILAKTDPIPNHAYCATGSMPMPLVQRLRQALLRLKPSTDAAKAVFAEHDHVRGFQVVDDEAYEVVRRVERNATAKKK